MTIHRYLSLREIAEAMGMPPHWLYRNVRRLEREHGFPPPAPGMGKRRDAVAVELWQRRGMAEPAPPTIVELLDLEDWKRELDRRAGEAA